MHLLALGLVIEGRIDGWKDSLADKMFLKDVASKLRNRFLINGFPLRNCYAHEIVAAFFGYNSRAALLADGSAWQQDRMSGARSVVEERMKILPGNDLDFPSPEVIEKELKFIVSSYQESIGNK